jgi:NAD(P)H-dependent flavin oxidoreductase YrpB (nitropropane dioxygenase family)
MSFKKIPKLRIGDGGVGVQMAPRFVATYECDASIEFKEAYLKCKEGEL